MFAQGGLFMEENAYVPEGGNEGERGATPTSIFIFDSCDMKTLWFEFGLYIERIKYWNASGGGPPPSLIPTL